MSKFPDNSDVTRGSFPTRPSRVTEGRLAKQKSLELRRLALTHGETLTRGNTPGLYPPSFQLTWVKKRTENDAIRENETVLLMMALPYHKFHEYPQMNSQPQQPSVWLQLPTHLSNLSLPTEGMLTSCSPSTNLSPRELPPSLTSIRTH